MNNHSYAYGKKQSTFLKMFNLPFFTGRFSLLFYFIKCFIITSSLIRLSLWGWQASDVSWGFGDVLRTFLVGFIFDLATVSYASIPAVIYFSLFPNKWIGSKIDRVLIWFFTSLTVFIFIFAFFAEFTFWEEFRSRFNFIAVDYLIYTHEVIGNINESYPLPILISAMVLLTIGTLYLFVKKGKFTHTFKKRASIGSRITICCTLFLVVTGFTILIRNSDAEWSSNRYNSELSKAGVYSFFAAFRNNQMKFPEFYSYINNDDAFCIVRKELAEGDAQFEKSNLSIARKISSDSVPELKKNVVFVLLESFSGEFMQTLGGKEQLTPFLDSLAGKSIFFRNIYAAGTRTVRGMEAVTLCIPPTPGQSIVKRPDNANLYTISNVFASKGYTNNFFYGGDGYFDNMNAYFGGNGFHIYDHTHGSASFLKDDIAAKRTIITDSEVKFENAWGISDEDIYEKMLEVSDRQYKNKRRFFNFVMTTSNHRPYSYPEGCIDLPSGKNREGAVKYTDHALSELFKAASKKPWYKDTVFIIIADHCASSAGKNEIDVANYRIPAFIVNMPGVENQMVDKQCSQIDLFPTFFSLANWTYRSNFFGKNVFDPKFEQRAFIATYRKLGLIKGNDVMVLSDQRKNSFYNWDSNTNSLIPKKKDNDFYRETISWYQTADYLFTNKLLK
ncbi:LTA synthase family protein [Flavobacterium terrisoli]|uniref:LTA synthase family protein n=1 Tax=Flavobacterium terrisoli TaxID=3242195 RepID=UPI002543DF02|nr:alkaline phosphatase family protein [Flavobacterium buctense]